MGRRARQYAHASHVFYGHCSFARQFSHTSCLFRACAYKISYKLNRYNDHFICVCYRMIVHETVHNLSKIIQNHVICISYSSVISLEYENMNIEFPYRCSSCIQFIPQHLLNLYRSTKYVGCTKVEK